MTITTSFSLLNLKLAKNSPEKFKYILATDRVNRKSTLSGFISKVNDHEYKYYFVQHDSEPFFVLNAKKVLFGFEIYIFDEKGTKKKLGYLRKYKHKSSFVLFQDNLDKILIKFKDLIMDQSLFKNIKVYYCADDNSILKIYKNTHSSKIFKLMNQIPKYNPKKKIYTLKYDNQNVIPCEKNFQLINDAIPDHINLSFGRLSENEWILTHSFPWNATQAFSIALSVILQD